MNHKCLGPGGGGTLTLVVLPLKKKVFFMWFFPKGFSTDNQFSCPLDIRYDVNLNKFWVMVPPGIKIIKSNYICMKGF